MCVKLCAITLPFCNRNLNILDFGVCGGTGVTHFPLYSKRQLYKILGQTFCLSTLKNISQLSSAICVSAQKSDGIFYHCFSV
jgi:hypothetical protein